MPRVLPWLVNGGSKKAAPKQSSTPDRRPPKRARPEDSDDDRDHRPRTRIRPDNGRSPSTSPVPEAPPEEFMKDGLDKDDIFRMVEDEFLETAKAFTGHLHHQEYKRLKKAARETNASKINSISRHVTVTMPDATKRNLEGVARAKKHDSTVKSLLGKNGTKDESDDSDDHAWLGTALHGLMENRGRSAAALTGVASIGASASTKAAGGFKPARRKNGEASKAPKPPSDEESTEYDSGDLDLPSSPPVSKSRPPPPPPSKHTEKPKVSFSSPPRRSKSEPQRKQPSSKPQPPSKYAQQPKASSHAAPSRSSTSDVQRKNPLSTPVAPNPDSDSDDSDFRSPRSKAATEALRRRLEASRQRKLKAEKKKEEDMNIIPTFLLG